MTMPAPDAWSYSGDPSASDKDAVRFYLQDVDPDVRLLSDNEINYLVGQWKDAYNGSLIYVASVAAEIVAFKFAGVPPISGEGVAVDLSRVAPAYVTLAQQLRQLYTAEEIGGEVNLDNLMWAAHVDTSLAPLRFGVGVMDNPSAGEQDYGGVIGPWWMSPEYPWGT